MNSATIQRQFTEARELPDFTRAMEVYEIELAGAFEKVKPELLRLVAEGELPDPASNPTMPTTPKGWADFLMPILESEVVYEAVGEVMLRLLANEAVIDLSAKITKEMPVLVDVGFAWGPAELSEVMAKFLSEKAYGLMKSYIERICRSEEIEECYSRLVEKGVPAELVERMRALCANWFYLPYEEASALHSPFVAEQIEMMMAIAENRIL